MSSKSLRLMAAGAITLWALIGAPRTGKASGVAGHWHANFNVTCVNGPQNAALCKDFFGPVKAIGHTGVAIIEQGYDMYLVSANGKYVDAGSVTFTENARGARKPANCGNELVARLVNGTCLSSWTGHGHIARGPKGLSIFYEDAETVRISGLAGSLSLKGAQANSGPPTPARAGHYSISWAAAIIGVKRVPAGISGGLVVTHSG
jgi:hypothetical protein